MSTGTDFACPACGSTATTAFHREDRIPTNSCLLLADRGQAEGYPRGDMTLHVCRACGFVANARFDPALSEYSSRYEETQGFSARFNDFARDLAKRWVDQYDLHGRSVLEIGCGKGEFLEMMCEAGAGRGIGIDPSAHPERRQSEAASRIEWITDFYSERYAHLQADAVVCRHTLEHIAPVGDFMRTVRRSIGDRTDTIVLFELPDVRRVLEEVAFWDVYYEHCSYFSAGSLARLFRATGFEVLDVSLDYDDQYLLIEARPSTTPAPGDPLPIEDDLDALVAASATFSSSYTATLDRWRGELADLRAEGGKAVIWGAGSKGVAFLTGLGVVDEIEYAVDINPHKHGMFMAGTGQQIVAPEALVEYRPDLVVVMNPVYLDEIGESLRALGLDPRVVAV
ncbi:MAG: class I SAM-dependent methyltransferase [Acidimicrobiia bacterium]